MSRKSHRLQDHESQKAEGQQSVEAGDFDVTVAPPDREGLIALVVQFHDAGLLPLVLKLRREDAKRLLEDLEELEP